MRNPLSFFMSNAVDSFRNSYIYYLVGLHLSDKFLVPLLLWNSIARKDRWGWLNCVLGGIFVLESLSWAKEYNIELEKQQNNLGKIHHMCSHIYLLWEKGLVFYLYLQKFHMDFSLSTVIFATANFDKRKFFWDTLYNFFPDTWHTGHSVHYVQWEELIRGTNLSWKIV